jgi:hypothetical protein
VRVTFLQSSLEDPFAQPEDYIDALRAVQGFTRTGGGNVVIQGSLPDAVVSILIEFGETLAPFFGPAFGAAISGWFQKRAGRTIRLNLGDIEVEASSQAELEQLLWRPIDFRERQTDAGAGPE